MSSLLSKKRTERWIAGAIIVFLLLVVCLVALVSDYSKNMDGDALDNARALSNEDSAGLGLIFKQYKDRARDIASDISGDIEESASLMSSVINQDIAFIRWFKDGKELDGTGEIYETAYSKRYAGLTELTVTGLYSDSATATRGFMVLAPTNSGACCDSILVLFQLDTLKAALPAESDSERAPVLSAVCAKNGELCYVSEDKGLGLYAHDELFKELRKMTMDKSEVERMEKSTAEFAATSFTVGDEEFIACINGGAAAEGEFFMLNIYNEKALSTESTGRTETVYSALIVMCLALLLFVIIVFITRMRQKHHSGSYSVEDAELDCPNLSAFSQRTNELVAAKNGSYAMVYTSVMHFKYLSDENGELFASNVLKFFCKLLSKATQTDESFCYLGEGVFAAFFRYKEEEKLYERIHTLATLLRSCPSSKELGIDLHLKSGVYFVEPSKRQSVQDMLDSAKLALKSGQSVQDKDIRIYDTRIREVVKREAEIESSMEAALRDGEFKVFYQPKYNIAKNRLDGSEALVRWFDSKDNKIKSPADFIPLFEANGFITEVDHHVFTEVCKFMCDMLRQGKKVVPISVNISRLTAIQPDFMSFYSQTKKKYNIGDGLLCLEFTESFAFENYTVLKELVEKLHANGFKCSVDDFGSGYSSFEILKELPFDELKLDRFFILRGISEERDNSLLGMIISLAKSLGLSVTQEGVETREDVEKLRSFGCDVIQGYVYSKPLPKDEYIEFVNSRSTARV